jgi:RNA polymerase sigma-70 factor (ECF subfamily)
MDPDAHLLARAQRGDTLAFGQLVQRHHSSVHRAARALLGSSADADDAVQDTWLHAYLHLAGFRGTATFKTWLHTIVRNRAIDLHRSARRRRRYDTSQASTTLTHTPLRSDQRSPEELVLDAERHDRLAATIATLPRQLRGPLELWHTGQYSYEQMAEMAGVTTGTMKSRIWQARQRVAHNMRSLPHNVRRYSPGVSNSVA